MPRVWHLPILLLALAGPAVGQTRAIPRPTVAEPLVIGLDPSPVPDFADMMLAERTATVTCDGVEVEPDYSEPLPPTVSTRLPSVAQDRIRIQDPVYAFGIQPDGRTRSIRRLDTIGAPMSGSIDPDIQSSLAAWRFSGPARDDCRLTLRVQSRPFADTSPRLLARALALSGDRASTPRLRAALARPGDDCRNPPRPDTAVFPDPAATAPPPGGRSWAVVRYAVDEHGRTIDPETLDASSDQAAEAVRRSAAETNFRTGQPRRGCLQVVSRYGEPLKDIPPTPDALQSLNRCSPESLARMTLNRLDYPDAFLDRGIEGWAVVRFDLSSWGEVGGIEVVAAEPASGFGAAAERIFQGARVRPAFEHAAGCAQRVSFRLPLDGEAPNAE